MLCWETLQTHLTTKTLARRGDFFSLIDSTNEEAKRRARAGAETGSVFAADYQSGGKGRLGRRWESAKGESLLFSLLLKKPLLPENLGLLPLLSGVAVCRTLREDLGLDARIKWPNDVLLGSRKVCGILAESGSGPDGLWAVVGMGLNLSQPAFPADLEKRATSLFLGRRERTERVRAAFRHLQPLRSRCFRPGTLPDAYVPLCQSLGRRVRFNPRRPGALRHCRRHRAGRRFARLAARRGDPPRLQRGSHRAGHLRRINTHPRAGRGTGVFFLWFLIDMDVHLRERHMDAVFVKRELDRFLQRII